VLKGELGTFQKSTAVTGTGAAGGGGLFCRHCRLVCVAFVSRFRLCFRHDSHSVGDESTDVSSAVTDVGTSVRTKFRLSPAAASVHQGMITVNVESVHMCSQVAYKRALRNSVPKQRT